MDEVELKIKTVEDILSMPESEIFEKYQGPIYVRRLDIKSLFKYFMVTGVGEELIKSVQETVRDTMDPLYRYQISSSRLIEWQAEKVIREIIERVNSDHSFRNVNFEAGAFVWSLKD